jgi:hypothetical protein
VVGLEQVKTTLLLQREAVVLAAVVEQLAAPVVLEILLAPRQVKETTEVLVVTAMTKAARVEVVQVQ